MAASKEVPKQYRRQPGARAGSDIAIGKFFHETSSVRCSGSSGETAFLRASSWKHGIEGKRDNSEFSGGEALGRLALEHGRKRRGCGPENGNLQRRHADSHVRARAPMDDMSRIASARETHPFAGPTDANVIDPSAKHGATAIYFLSAAARAWRRGPSRAHEMAAHRRRIASRGAASPPVARPLRVPSRPRT